MSAPEQRRRPSRDEGSAPDGGHVSSVSVPSGSADKPSTWKGDLAFATAAAVLLGVVVLRIFPELLQGRLVDTDSYMRLVRVRRLATGGGWFDGTIPRSNAPFGETLHWTRPLDVLILLGAWVSQPLIGFRRALHVSGALSSSLLLIGVCFTTAWAARPLAGRRLRYFTMLAVLAQPGIMTYAFPGRADHNMLLLLAFVGMVGSAIRILMSRGETRLAWITGAWAGFGLWVSTEFLVPLFMLLAAMLVVWVRRGEVASRARDVSFGLLTITVIAVLLEHAPADLMIAAYDRVSVAHVLVAGLVVAFWTTASSRRLSGLSRRGRLVFAAAGVSLAAALMAAVFPRFFGGPMVDVNPVLKETWLPLLTEFQPYLVPDGVAGAGRIVAYLGHTLLATAVVLHVMIRERNAPSASAWILLGIGLILFLPLGIRWVRFVGWAELLGAFGAMVVLSRLLERVERRFRGRRLAMARVTTIAGVLVGPLLLGAGIMAVGGEAGASARRAAATQTDACPVESLVSTMNDPDGLGDRPRTVLAHVDLGPVLLYRTDHSVVATPYHRNWRGILDWQRILSTRNPDDARRMIEARGIEVVVVCGARGADASSGSDAPLPFASLLLSGRVPAWLQPPSSPAPSGPRLRLYEVVDDGALVGG